MVRTALLVAAAAGVVVLVACEPASQRGSGEAGVEPPVQTAAGPSNAQRAPDNYLPIVCKRGGRKLDAKLVSVEDKEIRGIKIPTSDHELDIAAGLVPAGENALFVMYEVTGEDNDCQISIQHLSGTILPISTPYTLRLACWHLPGGLPCSVDDAIRVDDGTVLQNGLVITQGGKTHIEFKLQSLSTYALAAPGGPPN